MATPRELAMDDGHVLGNFHAYYSFNPVHERLRFMDAATSGALRRALLAKGPTTDAADPATVMDIGCNEGDLTLGLFKHLIGETVSSTTGPTETEVPTFDASSVSLLNEKAQKHKQKVEYAITEDGSSEHRRHFVCDLRIDGVSVARSDGVSKKVAKAKAATVALGALMGKSASDSPTAETAVVNATSSIENMNMQGPHAEERRRLCVLGVDVDEELITRASNKAILGDTKNSDVVTFVHANVMDRGFHSAVRSFLDSVRDDQSLEDVSLDKTSSSRRPFNLITLFSVTMWIHLNHGDDGLWKFLDAVSELTDHLIVEPQPWKCYRNAMNRLSRSRMKVPPTFTSLEVREHVVDKIHDFLLDAGRFHSMANLGKTNWSRPIRIYSRTPIPGIQYQPR